MILKNKEYKIELENTRKVLESGMEENPSSFRYDVFGPGVQFGAPYIDCDQTK